MSDLLKMNLVPNSLRGGTLRVGAAVGGVEWRGRKLASSGVGVAGSLLLMALCAAPFTPTALGQGQAGAAAQGQNSSAANSSAKPQAGAAAQPVAAASASSDPAQKSTDTAAQNEPKMEDQSAPPAESLGEAARRARAQKAGATKPKVFTDDSVTTLSGHGVSVVGDGSGGGGGTSYSGNAESGGGSGGGAQGAAGSQESYWRGRANDIRKQMAACDQRISEIQDEIAKHGAVTVDPMSGAQAGVIFVEDRNAQIKQVEKQKEELQNQLDALAEEGRKAGADSGWFR
jgi:hypothetical protein